MSSHSDLLAAQIQGAIARAIERGDLVGSVPANIPLERPKNRDHGDYASSIALQLAKPAGKNPREVAELLKKDLEKFLRMRLLVIIAHSIFRTFYQVIIFQRILT
jgi:arginyl-tRNA synthetase